MPDAFIPVAEQYGFIVPIGAWVLDEACRQMAVWRSAGMDWLQMAVNISPRQLSSPGLVEVVAEVLRRHDVEPSMVTLEITETALLDDTGVVSSQLEMLASLGVKLALDDFGTGYSALAHLKDFPVDILKVDRSFVSQLAGAGRADQIVGALVAMAHFLGLTVVGEGVETTEQWRYLEELGCDFGQGYLVSKPVAPGEIPAIVRRRGAASPSVEELVGRAFAGIRALSPPSFSTTAGTH
jgi:EAL domain-containing protein (putative c-di-GMP-specific phosphodiesterase class I)